MHIIHQSLAALKTGLAMRVSPVDVSKMMIFVSHMLYLNTL